MEYLMIFPKTKEMCITQSPYLKEQGWTMFHYGETIPNPFIDICEERGFSFIQEPAWKA